jgi:hypothetical protein
VEAETVILWTTFDLDGDQVRIDLYYSDNAGETWLPLAEGLPNTGYYLWQVSFLPAGRAYRVWVVAHDGVSAGSDQSDDVFTVGRPAAPPLALISPGPGRECWHEGRVVAVGLGSRGGTGGSVLVRHLGGEWQIAALRVEDQG